MASPIRDLASLLNLLGITEEGLSDVTENDLDVAFRQKEIVELEERRSVRSAWKRQHWKCEELGGNGRGEGLGRGMKNGADKEDEEEEEEEVEIDEGGGGTGLRFKKEESTPGALLATAGGPSSNKCAGGRGGKEIRMEGGKGAEEAEGGGRI